MGNMLDMCVLIFSTSLVRNSFVPVNIQRRDSLVSIVSRLRAGQREIGA
jgi:hypothetical protein